MFWPDVIALKEFYASPLGQATCIAVRRKIAELWPTIPDDTLLGVGFTTPYLTPFLHPRRNVLACMPAGQGVIHWPPGGNNLSFLSDEAELPFADNSIQRILVSHALENSENARQMMAEIWRVLAPTGRVLAVVPNRRGIWARAPGSPFAYGQPFAAWELRQLFAEHSFTALHSESALFFPPTKGRYMLRSARFWESIGHQFFSAFGGVLMVEAEKQIYAPAQKKAAFVRQPKQYVAQASPVGT